MPVTVLFAENREKLRENLRRTLGKFEDITVTGEAGNAKQLLQLAAGTSPDVIIMDANLPDMNSAATIRALLQQRSANRIIVYSTFSYPSLIEDMKDAGASGFILKDCIADDMIKMIHEVMQDETSFRICGTGTNAAASTKSFLADH
jgi:two-component system nitrate/nitrite response regulator NarL